MATLHYGVVMSWLIYSTRLFDTALACLDVFGCFWLHLKNPSLFITSVLYSCGLAQFMVHSPKPQRRTVVFMDSRYTVVSCGTPCYPLTLKKMMDQAHQEIQEIKVRKVLKSVRSKRLSKTPTEAAWSIQSRWPILRQT